MFGIVEKLGYMAAGALLLKVFSNTAVRGASTALVTRAASAAERRIASSGVSGIAYIPKSIRRASRRKTRRNRR
jgi:hypothetical protein